MSEENVDIRKMFASYLGIVYRGIAYWKWGMLICFIVTAAGTAYAATRKKIWDSRTRIRVVSTRVNTGFDPMVEDVQQELKNRLKAYISADRYLQDVIDEFGLYRDIKAKREWTDAEVLNYMRGKIEYGVYKGDEFSLTFYDHDPRVAQAVTQKMAENFMNLEKGADYNIFRTKLERVEKQLDRLLLKRDEFMEQETEFRRVNANLIKQLQRQNLGGGVADPVASSVAAGPSDDTKVTRYDSPQLRRLRLRLRDLEETSTRLRGKSGGQCPAVAALQGQKTQAQNEARTAKRIFDQRRSQYTKQHPEYQAASGRLSRAESRLREVDARIREAQNSCRSPSSELTQVQREIKQVRDNVRRQAAIDRRKATAQPAQKVAEPDAGAAEASDDPSVKNSELKLSSVQEVDAALKRMKTKMEPITQQIQELDAQRLKLQFQTEQREQGGARQYVVIDPARIASKPSGPPRTQLAIMSAVGGFVVGFGIMILIGFLDSRVYRPSDLGRLEHVALLTTVPDFEDEVKEIASQVSPAEVQDISDQADNQQQMPQG